jgi:hypothetical protein
MERAHAQHHPARDHLLSRKYALRELFDLPAHARLVQTSTYIENTLHVVPNTMIVPS